MTKKYNKIMTQFNYNKTKLNFKIKTENVMN